MRYRILPYKKGSASAKALAIELGGKVLKLQGSHFTAKEDDSIIGWGNTIHPGWTHMLNKPEYVKEVSNKLIFFNTMKELDITPKFWTNKDEITNENYPVVCRTVLAGHSGEGIVIANDPDGLVDCPLYVKYEKKKDEYRVHCGRQSNGETRIIAVQRKAKRNGAENVNWQVRSHNNGFVFIRNNIDPPPCVIEAAIKSFETSSLDFGAIDVIWNSQHEKAFVLEINTAPGLEGQTIVDYANFFKQVGDQT